jgi:serine protease Do
MERIVTQSKRIGRLKLLVLSLCVLAGLIGGAPRARAGEGASVAQSVLKVHATSVSGDLHTGSAVVIGEGRVVTACHVTQRATTVQLLKDGATYDVIGQFADVEHDMCLLTVAGLDRPAVKLASATQLISGQNVFAVGFAYGRRARVLLGAIEQLYDYDAGKVIAITAPFNHGDSGGGLFNDKGELVGVLAFMLGDEGARHFAVPVDWLSAKAPQAGEFLAIAPISDRKPFWSGELPTLPYFLQAVAHDAQENWEGLLDVAERWCAAAPLDVEACGLRGKALSALGRRADAASNSPQ